MEQGTLVGTILAWFMLLFAMMFDIFPRYRIKQSEMEFTSVDTAFINDRFWRNSCLNIYFASYGMMRRDFWAYIGKSWKPNSVQLVETLTLIIDVSKIARKNILAIEDALPSIENLFLARRIKTGGGSG